MLTNAGHDVEAVAGWSQDPGDKEILSRAFHSSRVVVTIDKDFGELAVVHRLPHRGIVRLVGFGAERHGAIAAEVLAKYAAELTAGAIVTVEPGRVRVRPAETGS